MDDPAALNDAPLILSNPFVQQQKVELAQLQQQRVQLSETLGPNHPDMVKLDLAIQNSEARIQTETVQIVLAMRSEYEAALAEERTLSATLNRQKQEAQVLNRTGIEYGVLQRDATANRQMFESLLQRTQETGVSEQLQAGNIRVVDAAEIPTGPVSPNVFANLLLGFLGGLTLAVGLVFGFEYLDDRIKNPDEIKTHLGLPFLGMVPALFGDTKKNGTPPLLSNGVSSLFAESFRSIRTNVLFSSTDDGGHLVVVTSSAPGEGKTVVSSNLAVALAHSGHRVLLIDCDMRKPRVHAVFSCNAVPGLSNLLVGNSPASEAIRESSTPGLWLMPAGTHPPNPAELLGSKRFKDFAAFLLQHFDWILLDTPPVMAVTDASIVANMSHGVLFVVGSEMTSRRVAQRAIEQLEHGQAKFIGAVLNRVDLEHNSYYYSRYYRPEYSGYYGPPGGTPGSSDPQPSERDKASGAGLAGTGAGTRAALFASATGARVARMVGIMGLEIDGTFTYPLIGRFSVGGMTLRAVEAALRRELVDRGFFRNPEVSVAIEQYRSQQIFIVGEVRTPGAYPMSGDMRLVEALALSGSTLPTASGEAVIVGSADEAVVLESTPGSADEAVVLESTPGSAASTGQPAEQSGNVVRVDLRALENGDLSQNVALTNGDTIFVLRAESVYVFGQVRNPGAYPLQQRDTTVLQALALAGGVTDRGSTGRIQIVRIVDGEREEIDAELTDFVIPRDTIVVPERFF